MYLTMTAIVATGVCVLVVLSATHSHRVSRQLAALGTESDSDIRAVTDDDARLERKLLHRLLEGSDLNECVGEYQRSRSALFPGAGPKWTRDDLARHASEKMERQAMEIRRKALLTAAVGLVLLVFVFGGAALVTYGLLSGSSGQVPLPEPINTTVPLP